jgi:hypothetical protein
MPKILFLHGWHSVPGGVKPTFLRDKGHEVINPPLDDDDFERACQQAQAAYDQCQPTVVVGSSRGGAIAMHLQAAETPLILLCPAWKRWGQVERLKPKSAILHSRCDDVVPFSDSEDLITASGLPLEILIEVGNDHRLADPQSLVVLEWLCRLHSDYLPQPLNHSLTMTSAELPLASRSVSEGTYVCDACGEEIVIPLDLSQGAHQSYVEDCPVCCHPNLIHLTLDELGEVQVRAEPEQDRD